MSDNRDARIDAIMRRYEAGITNGRRIWPEGDAAAEQRGAEAALLCVDEPSWEHHDQTDGFPCTNCLNKAQKSIDRYRADQLGAQDA